MSAAAHIVLTRRLEAIAQKVKYKDWHFVFVHEGPWYFQAKFQAVDVDTGEMLWHASRKWRISEHMTDSEIVQTMLKAVLTAEEHEAREKFTYEGRAIFGPHLSVRKLWEMAGDKDTR